MKRIIMTIMFLLICSGVYAGDTTTNGHFYLPLVGESGQAIRDAWRANQTATDAVIEANKDHRVAEDAIDGVIEGDGAGNYNAWNPAACASGSYITDIDADGTTTCSPAAQTDTNASTICSGTDVYLDGDGNCDNLGGVVDTNANTICVGDNTYLDGEGNCDIVTPLDEDALNGVPFVTVTNTGTLDSERVLTGGTDITIIDGGPEASITVNVDDSFLRNTGDTGVGAYDFSGATIRLPQSGTPITDSAGEVAMDTVITDHEPLLQFYTGTENNYVISVPVSSFPATDGQVIKYDAATNKFLFATDITGTLGGGSGATTDGGTVTYVTDTADDFAIGGDDATAAIFFDESEPSMTMQGAASWISSTGTMELGSPSESVDFDLTTSNEFRISSRTGVAVLNLSATSIDLKVPDEAYSAGWDGSNEVPTKNAVYDKMEAVSNGADSIFVDGVAAVDPYFEDDGDINFTLTGTMITADINTGTIIPSDFSDDDHGDFSYQTGSATIDDDVITAEKLTATNAPTNAYYPAYNSTTGGFTWTELTGVVGTADYQDSGADVVTSGTLNATGDLTLTNVGGVATITVADSYVRNTGDTMLGTLNLASADAIRMPQGTTPVTSDIGAIALDTVIVDHQPLWQYHHASGNMTIIAVDTSELPALDNEIIKYDAATDKFVFEAEDSGAGDIVTVNSTDVDTTGNFLTNLYSAFSLTDGGAGGPDDITMKPAYSATLAGNPALLTNEAVFSSLGIIFEGSTADTIEGLLTVTDPTSTDKTWTLPNATGTVLLGPGANGMVARTAAGVSTARTLTAGTNTGITISNGDGVSGNPTFSLTSSAALSGDHTFTNANGGKFGANGLIFEGSTADTFEFYLAIPNPSGSDKTITFPNETGTVCTTGSICAGYGAGSGTTDYQDSGADIVTSGTLNFTGNLALTNVGGVATATVSDVFVLNTGDTVSGTYNFTSATLNVGANTIDAITEIASSLRSGTDTTLLTGTSTTGECAQFDANGDLVGAGAACGAGSGGSQAINLPVSELKITGTMALHGSLDINTPATPSGGYAMWTVEFPSGSVSSLDGGAAAFFQIPEDYASTPSLRIKYFMESATSGTVEFEAALACVDDTENAKLMDAGIGTVGVASATVPGTVGIMDVVSISLNDPGCSPGDFASVIISTDADDGTNDTATGNRVVVGLEFLYD